jgi:hypothetical protein
MLIREATKLAKDLRRYLRDQVVVRYAVQNQRDNGYQAQLAAIFVAGEEEYFAYLRVSITFIQAGSEIHQVFRVVNLEDDPDYISKYIRDDWSCRRFDDWMHDRPFMGAYEVYENGCPKTSIKLDAEDDRWRVITGVLLGRLDTLQVKSSRQVSKAVAEIARQTMNRRFSAFALRTSMRGLD